MEFIFSKYGQKPIGTIRIELIDKGNYDVKIIVKGYVDVLSGKERAGAVWEALKDTRDSNDRSGGVLHGSLRNTSESRAGEL